jgi:hypothetical protein
VLLDRRLLIILPKTLDIGSDVQRLDVGDLAKLVMVALGEEPRCSLMLVFLLRMVAAKNSRNRRGPVAGDHARHHDSVAGDNGEGLGLWYGDFLTPCQLV